MPKADKPNFDALRAATVALRTSRGMSMHEMHNRSGISRTMLIRLEQGTARGSLETWFRIAKVLDVPLAQLVEHLERAPAGEPSRIEPAADGPRPEDADDQPAPQATQTP